MKAYAIICEYGAGSIHESIEMICKTEKIARSYYNDAEFYGRPIDIREIEIITRRISGSRPLTRLHPQTESRARCIRWFYLVQEATT